MAKPKIILWDLETSHNILAAFGLFNKAPIPHANIIQERFIICGCLKELGKPGVKAISGLDFPRHHKKDHTNDYYIVKALRDELSKADALVAHYGDKFDMKYINTRIMYHDLKPLPPIQTIDTYKLSKCKFNLNSYRLDYLGQFLGVGRKIRTSNDLWLDILKLGDIKQLTRMVKYCKQDVRLLEDVFKKLRIHTETRINWNAFLETKTNCPSCGSDNTIRQGYKYTIKGKVQRYQCKDCGKWATGNRVIS